MNYGNINLRSFKESDLDYVLNLARSSYTQDRYHANPDLPNEICDNFHESWIKNSCSGEIADYTVIAELDNIAVGYTTLKYFDNFDDIYTDKIGALMLSAVSPIAREAGIYTKMIHFGTNWLVDRGCRYIHLGTQVYNIPVQKSWTGLGYKIGDINTWLSLNIKNTHEKFRNWKIY